MSGANVDLVRRAYELLFAEGVGGPSEQDFFVEHCEPELELVPPPIYPDTDTSYRGLDGFHHWQRQIDEIFDEWRVEPERFVDADPHVLVFVRTSGRARSSGARVEILVAHLWTIRNKRLSRMEVFLNRADALDAIQPEAAD